MEFKFDQSSQIYDVDILALLAAFDEGVIITDIYGRIVFYNDTQSQIDELEFDYVIGKSAAEVYNFDYNSSIILHCIKSGRPILSEPLYYRTCQGKLVNTVLSVFPLRHRGRVKGAICFIKAYNLLKKKISKSSTTISYNGYELGNGTRFTFADIIGNDKKLLNSVKKAKLAADSMSPVMLYGETGTGKEMFAQSIHNHSMRNENRFIGIKCTAIPENLLECLLFGTTKGAFADAVNRPGLFEQAHGGTLYLDEVFSMPLSLQAKLLRLLQERKIRRVGGSTDIKIDVKIISSAKNNLQLEMKEGQIRIDLFYRLAMVVIPIPPLRKLEHGVESLTRHFINKYNLVFCKNVMGVSERVADLFKLYQWPGNISELEYMIEGAMNVIEAADIIKLHHLSQLFLPSGFSRLSKKMTNLTLNCRLNYGPEEEILKLNTDMNSVDQPNTKATQTNLLQLQKDREKQLIHKAISVSYGNVSLAAQRLGISRQLLHYKMKKYGLQRSNYL